MHEPAGPVTPATLALVPRPVSPATLTGTVATPPPALPHPRPPGLTAFIALTTSLRDGISGRLDFAADASAGLPPFAEPPSAPSSRSSIERGPLGLAGAEGFSGAAAGAGSASSPLLSRRRRLSWSLL